MGTRSFKLDGSWIAENTNATVKINNEIIFNSQILENPSVHMGTNVIGNLNGIDNYANLWVPTEISVSTGHWACGMFQWNGVWVPNSRYTEEQKAIISQKPFDMEQAIPIFIEVDPSLTQEEINILKTYPDPTYKTEITIILNQHNLRLQEPDMGEYTYGITSETSFCNRRNIFLNGQPWTTLDNNPIPMHAGDVLTFETLIYQLHPPIVEGQI